LWGGRSRLGKGGRCRLRRGQKIRPGAKEEKRGRPESSIRLRSEKGKQKPTFSSTICEQERSKMDFRRSEPSKTCLSSNSDEEYGSSTIPLSKKSITTQTRLLEKGDGGTSHVEWENKRTAFLNLGHCGKGKSERFGGF